MKLTKLLVFLLAACLLLLCACAKPTPEALVPEQPAAPVQEEGQASIPKESTPEEPEQVIATVAELHERLRYASFCPCIAEDGVRRHLAQLGAYAAPDTLFEQAFAAFSDALTADPVSFSFARSDTLWLFDAVADGYALQFLQKGPDGILLRALVYDGEQITRQDAPVTLPHLFWTDCSAAAQEQERSRIQETYDRLSAEGDVETALWRVCESGDERLALIKFSFADAQTAGFYFGSQTGGALRLNEEHIVEPEPDALLLACLRMNIDKSGIDVQDVVRLRGFLAESLMEDEIAWDTPVSLHSEYQQFYRVKNALLLFLRDLRADEELCAEFLRRENWALAFDSGWEFTLTAQGAQDTLTARLYPAGIDVDGYRTPSRKNFERLAQEGENSEQVPEDVKQQFILSLMHDIQFGRTAAGEFGTAQWHWCEVDGEPRLEVDAIRDSEELHITFWFIPDAAGTPQLTSSH